jgi:site-specific recombinase XerD
MYESELILVDDWEDAVRWAGTFLAGFKTVQTRRSYRRDLDCWFAFCGAHRLHPYRQLRRTHVEVHLRGLEAQRPPPANATLYRRVATLSSWFRWLEDEGGDAYALVCAAGPERLACLRSVRC